MLPRNIEPLREESVVRILLGAWPELVRQYRREEDDITAISQTQGGGECLRKVYVLFAVSGFDCDPFDR